MLSVIIPVYNGKDLIVETIESILKQNVEKELIIIDDCSLDGSYEFISELYIDNPLVKIIKNEFNMGMCKTANKGIRLARGEYIILIGQDDILESNHCEEMMKFFSDDVSMVFCDYVQMDGMGNVFDTSDHCLHKDKSIRDFCKFNTMPSVGLIMRADTLKNVGCYPENDKFPNYGEYHLWIRMAMAGRVVFCDSVRARYRRHQHNISNTFSNKNIRIKLNKYYNTCRKQIVDCKEIPITVRLYTLLFMWYYTFRLHFIGR